MDKFNLLNLLKQNIQQARHSERCYARNSFGMFAYGKGLIWILRSLTLPQNDGLWESSITKKISFTMAEILLSLTIIGVVAAITLPSLTGNINERTWNTQRKALYARMSQAIALMGNINGYGIGTTEEQTTSNAAKAFVTNGLAKVYKINNICDNEHLQDCGIPTKIKNIQNSLIEPFPIDLTTLNSTFADTTHFSSIMNTKVAAFETENGEHILTFYNPLCSTNLNEKIWNYLQPKMCANFIYDLNGKKGPNTVGKDIGFITAFYSTDSIVVSPTPLNDKSSGQWGMLPRNGVKYCREKEENSRLPDINELSSMFVNKNLIGNMTDGYWSSTTEGSNNFWFVKIGTGGRAPAGDTWSYRVHCVKR